MSSFGESLRRERELRGVSLREIADATKISVRFLQALEGDRVEILPGGVFRRSFLRQYARHLGLDADRIVEEFVAAHGPEEPDEPSVTRRGRESAHPGTIFVVAVFVLAALLSVIKAGREPRTLAPAPAAPPPAVPVAEAQHVPVTAQPVAAAPQGLVVNLSARQSCWVQASVDGQVVLNRVLEQGESQTLEAQGEVVLSVGNAGGLAFTVNDRPGVPLGRSGEVRRNIVITKKSLPSLVDDSSEVRAASHSS
jgi:cytoskeleton protein RodZ